MTRRERYLTILRHGRADALVWAPNFDHWLAVNRANGTVPAEYVGLSRNDVVRAVQATIWARTSLLHMEQPNVRVRHENTPTGDLRTIYETPIGCVETLQRYASDATRALFMVEHMVKRVEDVRVVAYMVRDTRWTLDAAPYWRCEREVADDGISLVSFPWAVPYIQFGKVDAGWLAGLLLLEDHPHEVQELLDAYAERSLEAAQLLAAGPCPVVNSPDNMDEWTMPPRAFLRHAVPYYREIAQALHQGNKTFKVHWCGRTKRLLPFVPGTGIDVVEAIVPVPMSDLTIPEALDMLRGEVVLQGGVPSILMCPQGGSRDDLRGYIGDLLAHVPHGERFVLGMSDNVPPDADFARVKLISEMVNAYDDTHR